MRRRYTVGKYNNNKIVTKDGKFDSKREYERWQVLKLAQKQGLIDDLQRQVKYVLIPSQKDETGHAIERPCTYIADFVYTENGKTVVEDSKGFRTPEYVIKRKLMLYIHGLQIIEV